MGIVIDFVKPPQGPLITVPPITYPVNDFDTEEDYQRKLHEALTYIGTSHAPLVSALTILATRMETPISDVERLSIAHTLLTTAQVLKELLDISRME